MQKLIQFIFSMLQILVLENDTATVMGTMIVVDYRNVSLNHLVQASPSILKKLVAVSQVGANDLIIFIQDDVCGTL